MEVIIRPTSEAATRLAAAITADAIRAKPDLVLGLATGRTMERLYAILVEDHLDRGLNFSRVRTFNLDEYIGIGPDHPQSYRYYMDKHLFGRINIVPKHAHLPDGLADNVDEECAAYERRIAACGGIDLQVLGIGLSGHIGFNEPLSALHSRTRAKALSQETIDQNASQFKRLEDMPLRAMTMGVGTILDSRRCVLLAVGESKADIVAKAVEGPVTSMISASALQFHPKCVVILDEEAASRLEHRTYYDRIYETEPEWAPYRDAGL
mgnify:CR=1 FL=1